MSISASAKWTEAASNDDYTVFIDPDTLAKSGNQFKMWELRNFKTVQTFSGKQYLSMKTLVEFDCKKEKSRSLAGTLFSGNMGLGTVVGSENAVQEWQPVETETEGRMLWKIVCGKR